MIFSQGKAIILLNEYDNRIRFKVFDKNLSTNSIEPLNLTTNSQLYLSFIYDDGQKIYINSNISSEVDPTTGEFEFTIDGSISQKLLTQTTKRFFIISSNDNRATDETVLYQGRFENFSNRKNVVDEIEAEKLKDINRKIAELEKLQKDLENKEKSVDQKINISQNLIAQENLISQQNINTQSLLSQEEQRLREQLQNTQSLLSQEEQRLREKLQSESEILDKKRIEFENFINESLAKNKDFVIKEIPGESVNTSASLKLITPKVLKPSEPNTLAIKSINPKINNISL